MTPASTSSRDFDHVVPKLESASPPHEKTDFESALLEYGRAVIRSAMEHGPDEVKVLEDQIATTRGKVVTEHENSLKASQTHMVFVSQRNARLCQRVESLSHDRFSLGADLRAKAANIIELERELYMEKDETSEYARLWSEGSEEIRQLKEERGRSQEEYAQLDQECAELREECSKLRNEKKKRKRVEEIWERVEKVKV